MDALVGRLLKLVGDAVTLVTVLFVAAFLLTRHFNLEWPREIEFLYGLGARLQSLFGPAWWAMVVGLGAVFGFALSRMGRNALAASEQRHSHYRR